MQEGNNRRKFTQGDVARRKAKLCRSEKDVALGGFRVTTDCRL